MNAFYEILKLRIQNKEFACVEDAIDEIARNYKLGRISKEQRAELLEMV